MQFMTFLWRHLFLSIEWLAMTKCLTHFYFNTQVATRNPSAVAEFPTLQPADVSKSRPENDPFCRNINERSKKIKAKRR